MTITREQIAAYADGELSGDELATVEAAVEADPALKKQVAQHRMLKATLGAHFAPILDDPVPERLSAAVGGGGEVIDFAAARAKRQEPPRRVPRWAWVAGSALAASLALAVFLPRMGGGAHGDYADTHLAAVLDNQLVAGGQGASDTRVLLSFADKRGELCRAFASDARSGIACRDDSGWRIAKTMGAGDAETGEYRQAGSAEAALMTAVQDMAEGPALDASQEAAARAKGWRP